MRRFKNQHNADEFPRFYETNNAPSMTIPNQAMTIPELLDRYARGLPLDQGKKPIYHGEEFVPDLDRMDLSEIHDLKQNVDQTIRTYQDYQDAMKSKATKDKADKYKQMEKELAELKAKNSEPNE